MGKGTYDWLREQRSNGTIYRLHWWLLRAAGCGLKANPREKFYGVTHFWWVMSLMQVGTRLSFRLIASTRLSFKLIAITRLFFKLITSYDSNAFKP